MDIFETHYYNRTRIFLFLIGQWPYDRSRSKYISRFSFCFIVWLFTIAQVLKLVTAEFSIGLAIDVIPPLLFCVISSIKYLTCSFSTKLIIDMLDNIKLEWTILTERHELAMLQDCAEEANLYSLFYMSFTYSGTFVFLSLQYIPYVLDAVAPLNESRPNYHPFKAEYFVDPNEYFLPILLHMQLAIIMAMTWVVATDGLSISIILHICGMFKIIGYRLEHVFDEDIHEYHVHWKKISKLVQYHHRILRFVNKILACYTLSILIQLVLIVITLTGLLLQLHVALTPLEDMGFVILTVFRVIGHFLVVFLNILPGQRVLDASTDMFIKAYSADWYLAPVKTQKLMLFLMQRMIEPSKFSIANFLQMKFEMFATISQLSMSYFTVIHSVQL